MQYQHTCTMRDQTLIALREWVLAQSKVCLAFGETNETWWITRSVIHSNMREHTLSTIARNVSRAFELLLDDAYSLYTFFQCIKKTINK